VTAVVVVDPETEGLACARCGLSGALPTAGGMLHQPCFEKETEDAFAAGRGFYPGGDLNEWFATGDVRRSAPRQDSEWRWQRGYSGDPPALAVLRDLCRDTSTSWRVSDLPGRGSLEGIWRDACRDRLGMDGDAFDAARDALIEAGKVGHDRPELPSSLASDHWRVYPRRGRR
jgi:hypothetical protein